jgi:hypothetical protein
MSASRCRGMQTSVIARVLCEGPGSPVPFPSPQRGNGAPGGAWGAALRHPHGGGLTDPRQGTLGEASPLRIDGPERRLPALHRGGLSAAAPASALYRLMSAARSRQEAAEYHPIGMMSTTLSLLSIGQPKLLRRQRSHVRIVSGAPFCTELGTPKPAVLALDAATSVRGSKLFDPTMRIFAFTSTRWASVRRGSRR